MSKQRMSNEAHITKAAADQPDELDRAAAVLAEACAELQRLTGVEPPGLHEADMDVNAPPLFVYGILGGKDVGKTTLINALAESRISHEAAGIGEGTHTPVVYVHHDDAPLLRDRLGRDPGLEFDLVTHDRQLLRHVALVDLPDFDSKRNLPDHARRAAAFKPYLDAFLWVTTVRKIDHPELLRQMNSVAPKKDNFYCVVTFADEVIRAGKDSLDGLRAMCIAKLRQLYFADFAPENLFAICTLDKSSYDFPSLTHELVRQHSPREITERRRRNALRSAAANVELVRRHYQLDESLAALDALVGELPDRCAENMPAAYWDIVTERVGRLDGPYRRMAARLFAHRIWGWPILSALLFPLSAVVSFLGGRLFFETGSRWSDYHQLKDILSVDGLGLEVRMKRVASELKAKYLRLHQAFRELLGGELEVADELDQWAGWLDEHDRKALDDLQDRYGRPNFAKRWLVYLPLLWFPIVQPVLESFLNKPELTSGKLLQGLALTAVSLLSAGYLLRSAAVLFIIYTLWLLWFYSSSARQVARQRLTGFAGLRQSVLEPSLADRLRASYDHLADTLRGLRDRLVREAERMEDELGKTKP
jgi:hypothetical protein